MRSYNSYYAALGSSGDTHKQGIFRIRRLLVILSAYLLTNVLGVLTHFLETIIETSLVLLKKTVHSVPFERHHLQEYHIGKVGIHSHPMPNLAV
jgi:hypothetical protein